MIGEVATARAVLTTPQVKARYDAKMQMAADAAPTARRMGPAEIDALLPSSPLEQTVTMPELPKPVEDLTPQPTPTRPSRWAKPVSMPPEAPELPTELPTALPDELPHEAPPVTQARLIAGPGTAFAPAVPPATNWLPETVSNIPPLPPVAAPDPPVAWPAAAPAPNEAVIGQESSHRSRVTARRAYKPWQSSDRLRTSR